MASPWSHSRLESYRNCPRQFYYRYVKRVKLPKPPETIERFVGKRVHESLEWLYTEVLRGRTPALPALIDELRGRWRDAWHDAITMPGGERPEAELLTECERWLTDHHDRFAPFTGSRIVSLEQRIQFPLDEAGEVQWVGFVDKLTIAPDGTWQIHDYKTNRKLPTQQAKDADPQLAYYEIGVRRMWPDEAQRVELTWHFLNFGVSITSRRTPEQLTALRAQALETIREVGTRGRDEAAFPPQESRLCDWCEFQVLCPVRKHLVKVAELPPNRFANEPGVKLVDHWTALDERRAELKRQVEALEAEIAEVRDAIAAFAEREQAEVIAGSEREASVQVRESVAFPTKGETPEEHGALEAQLRGSRWWSEASSLDRYALARLWQRRESLDRDLRALLEEFARSETSVDVRLRKPKKPR